MQTLCCVFVSHPHENDENDVSCSMKTQNFENDLQSEKIWSQGWKAFSVVFIVFVWTGKTIWKRSCGRNTFIAFSVKWKRKLSKTHSCGGGLNWLTSLPDCRLLTCQTWTAQTSWVGITSRQFSSKIIKPSFHFCFKQCQNDSRTFVVGTSILFFRFIDPVLTVQTAIYKSYCSLEVGRHCVAQDRRLPGTRKACLNFISLRHDKLFVFALELEARFQSWEFVAKSLLSLQ